MYYHSVINSCVIGKKNLNLTFVYIKVYLICQLKWHFWSSRAVFLGGVEYGGGGGDREGVISQLAAQSINQ